MRLGLCPKSITLLIVALATLACAACGRGKALYPVEGQVFYEGQPATGALVVLHPDGDSSPAAVRPSGYVDAEGKVRLSSYLASSRSHGEGAPAGAYIVTISWLPTDVKEYLSKHPNAPLPDKLQGRYSRPDSSTLRAKIPEQSTELPRIDLKKEGAVVSSLQRAVTFSSHRSFNRELRCVAEG